MKLKTLLFLCLLSAVGYAQNSSIKHHNVKTVELYKVQGYLEHLPPDYDSNPSKTYPLLVFLHGASERGNTSEDLYKVAKNGPPKEIENQGSLCFEVNGKQECFIVLSPQLTGQGNWTGYAQKEFWNYILNGPNNYRYDPNRIYLTGLSLGGNGVYERAYDEENTENNLAAIAPLCAWANNSKGCTIAERNIPVWAFHGTSDDVIGFNAGLSIYNAVNDCPANTQQNKFTAIEGGEHWIWNDVYKTDHSHYAQNVYEWLLSHTLNKDSGFNQPPTVDAGKDVNKSIGVDSLHLTAQASDPEGSSLTYLWEKISGKTLLMSNTNSPKVTLEAPNVGSYELKVTVTDVKGAKASDQVVVNITDTTNQTPIVSAGKDISTTVNQEQIYLIAEASDSDGTITTYQWQKLSGPESVRLWNPDRPKLTLVKFTTGTYIFQVTVQDNKGAIASDQVTVVVSDTTSISSDTTSTTDNTSSNVTVGTINNKVSTDGMPYLEYLPPNYDQTLAYPTLVYLHSKNAEGNDTELLKNEGPMYFAAQGKDICSGTGECFIVLSPQVAKGSGFWKGKMDRFYDYILKNYAIKPSQVFLAGFDEGAHDGLIRLTDDTNSPNRWSAIAVVSYSIPNSKACNIASSGAAFYMANSISDEDNNYNDALAFYNEVDHCTTNPTYFIDPSGNQVQSGKNVFNPSTSNLYDWLLNYGGNTKSTTNARMSSTQGNINDIQKESKKTKELNFLVNEQSIQLTRTNDLVYIEVKSILGITVKSVSSYGELTLNNMDKGIYFYQIKDLSSRPIQNGRIIKQ